MDDRLFCEYCNIKCRFKSGMYKHKKTRKHMINLNGGKRRSRLLVCDKYVKYSYDDEEGNRRDRRVTVSKRYNIEDAIRKMYMVNGGMKADHIDFKTNLIRRDNKYLLKFDKRTL